ncbi:CPBP family intramembrane metalloprotease [Pontibacter sp. JH31]|uniref:CPBP family intramembrane metalloprotease n=1 Tax=Pontibacter aquaedesilientis TaxID=2766980 RepID=A0ABR7XE45_9BACT|nr:CPBP family intramembrane glutamic endopeptidase [Pontibacter aquaedesilientis]MBD1395878.1 CPBP family intramembrane metalloprotease [Pontibacter aquaedesilientis]
MDFSIFLILIAISYFKPIPFPWKVPAIAFIIIIYILYFYKDLKPIGLGQLRWKETLLWGAAIALTIVVGVSNIFNPIMERLLDHQVDVSAYGPLKGNSEFVLDYWWKAMISAAIAEEIFYRGFTFYFLERVFNNFKYHQHVIVLLTALYFGFSHSFQGITGVLGIMVAALVFGSGYYLSRKNLYALFLAHALVDSWSLFSLYKGGISLFF